MVKTEFEVRFPSCAKHFGVHGGNYLVWRETAEQRGIRYPSVFYAQCEGLICYAASWHSSANMFVHYRFFSRLYAALEGAFGMARPNKKPQKRATWKGFLDFRLGEQELQELDEWSPAVPEIWESVDTLLKGNYRVTLSYSSATQTATCTIIDDDTERPSGGWALASSDRDGALALKTAVYKHFLVLEGNWERLLDLPAAGGRRG